MSGRRDAAALAIRLPTPTLTVVPQASIPPLGRAASEMTGRTEWIPGCRLLLVDGEPEGLPPAVRALIELGAVVTHERRADQAIACCLRQEFDAVILDIALPDASGGTRIFNDIHRQYRCVPIVVWSRDTTVVALMRHRAETILKPVSADELLTTLNRALSRARSALTL